MTVKTVLIGEKYFPVLQKPLTDLGLRVVPVPCNPLVDPRLSGHVDLSVLYPGGDSVFLAPYLKGSGIESEMAALGLNVLFPDISQSRLYPCDARMNVCIAGKTAFLNRKTVAQMIDEYLTRKGFKIFAVNQGYTGCSVCVLPNNGLITADRGVWEAAGYAGFDCLLIEPGHIELEGFDYGFIGGASFALDDSTVAFTGRFDAHPDKDCIMEHLKKHGVKPLFLTQEPIFDIGSAIVI